MGCVTPSESDGASFRVCHKCGVAKTADCYGVDRATADGLNEICRTCRRLSDHSARAALAVQGRVQRVPRVLGLILAEDVVASILGALRMAYDGRLCDMLTDLRLTLAGSVPVQRLNAMLTLLALREIGIAVQSFPPVDVTEAVDMLPDVEWRRLAARQAKRRSPPV